MALTQEDRNWMDDRFDRMYDLIGKNKEGADARMNDHSTKISAVSIGAVKAVSEHEKEHHNPAKRLGMVASITAIASGIGGGIAWLMSKFGGGEK